MRSFFHDPVNIFYCFILFYIVLVPVDSGFVINFFAVFFVISIWALFQIGGNFSLRKPASIPFTSKKIHYISPRALMVILGVQYISSAYAISYYTGLSIHDVIINFISGDSNYALYQAYFREQNIGAFTIGKVPAILSIFFFKAAFIFIVFSHIVRSSGKGNIAPVLLATVPFALFGFARGTSFELFEIFLILICAMVVKGRIDKTYKLPFSKLIFSAMFLASLHTFQVLFRYGFNYSPSCPNEYCYASDSVVFQFAPGLYNLSGYFYFAPDYMSRWFEYFVSGPGVLHLFLPGVGALHGYHAKWLCGEALRCGPTWAPDFERVVYLFGLLGAVFFIFLLSYVYKALKRVAHVNFFFFLGFYLVVLQVISLPIGSFLMVSSANIIMLICFLCFMVMKVASR